MNTSIGINNNWGTLLDRAESLLTEVAEIAPDFSEAYFWRGRIFANQSDYSGAVSLFERAIDKLDHDREHYNSKYIEYQQFLLEVKVQQQSKNIEQRYNELEKGAEKVENTLEDVESRVDHVQSAIDEYRGQILQFLGFFTAIIH